jgi:hypothetical protein
MKTFAAIGLGLCLAARVAQAQPTPTCEQETQTLRAMLVQDRQNTIRYIDGTHTVLKSFRPRLCEDPQAQTPKRKQLCANLAAKVAKADQELTLLCQRGQLPRTLAADGRVLCP